MDKQTIKKERGARLIECTYPDGKVEYKIQYFSVISWHTVDTFDTLERAERGFGSLLAFD